MCWSGRRFGDIAGTGVKYLAEHPEPGIYTAWIANKRSIRHQLRSEGHRRDTAWSSRGMRFAALTDVFVYDSLRERHDLRRAGPQRRVVRVHATRVGPRTSDRIRWAGLNGETKRYSPTTDACQSVVGGGIEHRHLEPVEIPGDGELEIGTGTHGEPDVGMEPAGDVERRLAHTAGTHLFGHT